MKLATYRDGSPDGRLMVVSRDLRRALDAGTIAPNATASSGRLPAVPCV